MFVQDTEPTSNKFLAELCYPCGYRHVLMFTIRAWGAGPVYKWDTNLVIIVPADGLALYGARPSAGTVMAINLAMFSYKFHWLLMIWHTLCCEDDVIQNVWQDFMKSNGTQVLVHHGRLVGLWKYWKVFDKHYQAKSKQNIFI